MELGVLYDDLNAVLTTLCLWKPQVFAVYAQISKLNPFPWLRKPLGLKESETQEGVSPGILLESIIRSEVPVPLEEGSSVI